MKRPYTTILLVLALLALVFALPTAPALAQVEELAAADMVAEMGEMTEIGDIGLDQRINETIAPLSDAVTGFVFYTVSVGETRFPVIVVWLILTAVIFTFYFRFINFWGFAHAISVVRGRHTCRSEAGEVTHFQALTAALSGTVGLGNIAGVAAAIALGGPGATLWMIIAAFFGMASKFLECSLGAKYREVHEDGTVSGGAMYYLSRGLADHGLPRLGRVLATFFAVMCVGGALGAGNMFQANQAFQQVSAATGDAVGFFNESGWLFGLILAGIVALVIIGGIKSIAHVTEFVVPFMGLFYVLSSVVILFIHADQVPTALRAIFVGAFTPEAGYGGLIGVLMWGFQRATFSNEAGIGSAPIAYSAVQTDEPLSVGFVSLLEPFIDTVIICSMTALVIVISGVYLDGEGLRGVEMTSAAFASAFDWFPYLLAVAVTLFAFSTIITWSYYGLKSWTYLFGENPASGHIFKLIFCTFTVIGASMELGKVIGFSDAMIFAMALPNGIGMFILARGVKRDLKEYWAREGKTSAAQ